MAKAMANVVPSHLMDRNLFPFTTLHATGEADPAGDRAFDDDEVCAAPAEGSVLWHPPH
jgi:tRNA 2-thiocytidine biosynthesis protein TtcA